MRRRDFMAALAAGSTTVAGGIGLDTVSASLSAEGQINPLVFDSAASLLNAEGRPLTDESVVAVWAGQTASNKDADGSGDAVSYGSRDIPMVAVDGDVLGFGGIFVTARSWQKGNEEFYLNAWDEHVGTGSTVLWDESHDQYYGLSKVSGFATYARDNGYTVSKTTDLEADLSSADAVVVTSPKTAFTDGELSALSTFVENGGTVFLHDQSDYSNYDQTANLNAVASELGVAFRFNDDQVVDASNNGGAKHKPVTDRFTSVAQPYLRDREGLGLKKDETYTATVQKVLDGDTIKAKFPNGTTESIRVLGVDTAEKPSNQQYERKQEWEGIESLSYLGTWGNKGTQFAKNRFSKGDKIEVFFDQNEGIRDPFGRVLGYVRYDGTLYNEELIRRGRARVYGSGLSKHDQFQSVEKQARAAGRGIWSQSDPSASTVVRNSTVSQLFFPKAAAVKTRYGSVSDDRVPVFAAESASQSFDTSGLFSLGGSGPTTYSSGTPLVGVDEDARVGLVGAPIINEDYEKSEGYAVDTSGYGNFAFLTNLIDYLKADDRTGDVVIDGGHGQFNAGYALSNEDAAYYQRYLEGFDIGFDQFNDIAGADLSGYRAVIVTTPVSQFSYREANALSQFASNGGAVVLMGSGKAPGSARQNLNMLARDIGTDLRLNSGMVRDSSNNLNNDPTVITTSNFSGSFPLFSPYGRGNNGGGDGGSCDHTETTTRTGSLSGSGDDAEFSYSTRTSKPCGATFSLSADSGTDFDLYLTFDGRTPSPSDYDKRSWTYGSDESIEVTDSNIAEGQTFGVLVESYSGSGSFTLTVEETGDGPGSGGGGGGGGGDGGDCNATSSHSGRLDEGESDTFTYDASGSCDVTVTLSGASDADFDLYATFDGRRPTVFDYDARSWTYGSGEEIEIKQSKIDGEVGILVDAYSGSGKYDLTVEEGG